MKAPTIEETEAKSPHKEKVSSRPIATIDPRIKNAMATLSTMVSNPDPRRNRLFSVRFAVSVNVLL